MLSLKKLFLLASEQLLFEVPVFSSTFKQPNYLPMSTNNHLKKKVTAVISILFFTAGFSDVYDMDINRDKGSGCERCRQAGNFFELFFGLV
jgi:hypothetical protein